MEMVVQPHQLECVRRLLPRGLVIPQDGWYHEPYLR